MIIAIQLAFSLGISLISLLSYLIYQWKYIVAFWIFIPSVIALVAFRLVEETPEFTLKKGYACLLASFNRIAAFNRRDPLEQEEVEATLAITLHYSFFKELVLGRTR